MKANGAVIRALRQANKCGIRDFARQIDRTRGFVSQVETGQRGASKQTLDRIAEALNVHVDVITDRERT